MLKKTLVVATLCAAGLAIWPSAGLGAALRAFKTITLGEFASFTLRSALDAADCGIRDLAEEILARPAFASTKTNGAEETPCD